MIFTKIKLENFGLFRGEHIFDLSPESSEKPVILFGGKNGTGKTTIFEAVKLCLYGNAFHGSPLSNTRYEKLLNEKIHRDPSNPLLNYSSITVEFKYIQFGKVDRYSVKRFWQTAGSHVKESLEIYKNAQILSDIEIDQWQDFVRELIPQGVTRLFFFDGEQIQNLATEERNNIQLKESFDSLVGLDIVERLLLDLKFLKSRMRRQSAADDTEREHYLSQLYLDHDKYKKEFDVIEQNLTQIENNIQYTRAQIQNQEEIIAHEGGGYATKRQELKDKKIVLDDQINNIENEIRDLCAGLLPFSIAKEYCFALKDQILSEEEHLQHLATRKAVEKKLIEFKDKLADDDIWKDPSLNESIKLRLTNRIVSLTEQELIEEQSEDGKPKIVHNLSGPEQQKIMGWIHEALTAVPSEIKELSQKLEKLTRERQEIEKALVRSPPEEVLNPYIQELNRLHTKLGAEEQKLEQAVEQKRSIKFKMEELVRKIAKEHERNSESEKLSEKERLIETNQLLLTEYLNRIRKQKLRELEENFITALYDLSHKKIYEKVSIHEQDDFSIVLYDSKGNAIPKEHLSAGEKQIYAIAMLWALAKTSGRSLPFIIDTPLGRLDSDHRLNLVSNFFPYAGHQVIILSTDKEIDKDYFEKLEPYVSKAYHLTFNRSLGATSVSEGYFWKSARNVKEEEEVTTT